MARAPWDQPIEYDSPFDTGPAEVPDDGPDIHESYPHDEPLDLDDDDDADDEELEARERSMAWCLT